MVLHQDLCVMNTELASEETVVVLHCAASPSCVGGQVKQLITLLHIIFGQLISLL